MQFDRRSWGDWAALAWCVLAVLGIAAGVMTQHGCSFPSPPKPPPVVTDNLVPPSPFFPFSGGIIRTITEAPDTSVLGWIAALCFFIGFLCLVASFVPSLALFIPKSLAVGAILAGVGALALKYFLAKYFPVLMFLVVIGGVIVGSLFTVIWIKRNLRAAAAGLALSGNPLDARAATALTIAASPAKMFPNRKSLLAHFEKVAAGKAAGPVVPTSAKNISI